jgi:hypothetical protein
MKTISLAICFTLVAALGTLSGCASQSKPTTAADVMRGHASDAQEKADLRNELAENWERGQKMIESGNQSISNGERNVTKAENDLRKAQERVAEGRRQIAEGTALVQESEQRFRESFPGLELRADN